jgi:Arc/MetJ-type ribon-helix-helix transcriptional regulator
VRDLRPWIGDYLPPNMDPGNAYAIIATIAYTKIKYIIEQTVASGLIYLNSHASDFKNPEIGPYLDRYLRGYARTECVCEKVLKARDYRSASEVICDALRVLQQRQREDGLKLKALRMQLKAGIDALELGDFVEIDEADLDGYLERLTAPPGNGAH